ncbi:epoxide hydrolase family protein [Actinacidiphila rubida]|uniref:Pimeloyl-ACP methyl ester carboxylesterase n=1 Tax=Actinacidiphila rubida TaxID=310780 RepID=A0A1H8QVS8_9ACTN|nr:epoxide hydrolase [Actinacidiphila rubida]SEO58146.1 Pimeloyl-ACP methyl ester carboxylesterase [Actinacidiphila rubida]
MRVSRQPDLATGAVPFQPSRRSLLRTATVAGLATVPAVMGANLAFAGTDSGTDSGIGTVGPLRLPEATEQITPLHVNVPEALLRDLRHRLASVRLPDRETVGDASQGVQLAKQISLLQYWRTQYDWRRFERRINALGQYRTRIDGLGIHFLHVRSRHADATPLILTHGWPGSFVEFLKAIGPLTDPTAYGGTAQDAFHVVIPSQPGFGFSDRPSATGWTTARTAAAWAALMERLGYRRYIAQGGDWGGGVTTQLGKLRPKGLIGTHLNFPEYAFSPPVTGTVTAAEQAALDEIQTFSAQYSGYFQEQTTRPQTIGYALADSPSGQASWIYEKFLDWTDNTGRPQGVLSTDEILDNITLYWLTDTAASSARIYWQNSGGGGLTTLELPVGLSVFPHELVRSPRIWAERAYSDLAYFNDQLPFGGHFAAFEQPQLFAEEVRKFTRLVK